MGPRSRAARSATTPQDDAEEYAAEIESAPETETDRAEGAHVGGPFATGEFDRAAFD